MDTINNIYDKNFTITADEYDIFKAFFKQSQNSSEQNCSNAYLTRCVATVIGANGDHWRIIGISKKALECLRENNFNKPKLSLQRGHLIPRSASISLLFRDRQDFVSKEEFERIYSIYDLTILMTNQENKSSNIIPDFYLFDQEGLGLFKNRFISFDYNDPEIAYMKSFYEKKKDLYSLADIYPRHLKTHIGLDS